MGLRHAKLASPVARPSSRRAAPLSTIRRRGSPSRADLHGLPRGGGPVPECLPPTAGSVGASLSRGPRLLQRALPVLALLALIGGAAAAETVIYGDRPNPLRFEPTEARFVRLSILGVSGGGQPCIDELEIYDRAGAENLAVAEGAKAEASSCIAGYPQHTVAHLNDGAYGNAASWISAGSEGEWAQIDLGQVLRVDRVVFSRDREGQFADRIPTHIAVQVSRDGAAWETAIEVAGKATSVGRPGTFRGVVGSPPPMPPKGALAGTAPSLAGQARRLDELGLENLALAPQAKPAASSCIEGFAIHRTANLNDGQTGNDHSWIANAVPAWVEIDLGQAYWISHIAFGNDQGGRYQDRAVGAFRVLGSRLYAADSADPAWTVLYRHGSRSAVIERLDIQVRPVQVRWLRLAIDAAAGSDQPRVDEIEVFGSAMPIPADKVGPLSEVDSVADPLADDLRYAFLGEEHAWLKVAGHADLSTRLVPYNGRVQDYPRHAGDDVVPLAELPAAPTLDGRLGEVCWERASRAVGRVAWPYEFEAGPLLQAAVQAGIVGDQLCLAVEADRWLSAHLAVVSAGDGEGCGVVTVLPGGGLEFRRYRRNGESAELNGSEPVRGALDRDHGTLEAMLPLAWFPGWEQSGVRVGVGMGGRHTAAEGRGVFFLRAPFALCEASAVEPHAFVLRLHAETPVPPSLTLAWPGAAPLEVGWTAGGASITVPGRLGVAGPQQDIEISGAGLPIFRLHLFRYDPVGRVFSDLDGILSRLGQRGVALEDLAERARDLRARQAQRPPAAADRALFFAARGLKRDAFLRDPDLVALQRLLFVKRQPFHPSHNYSDFLDASWRPGGAICRLDMPIEQGRLAPEKGVVTPLFESGQGVARDPAASADAERIYFSYRASREDFFRITVMKADGSELKTLGEGPYNDVYPCPLPDGDLAFISTRCRARFLCWRPQAYVLFRMTADGADMRPLSYANLSEWAPALMRDGRLLWTRSEYVDKGADFSHTLWAIRPDGTHPELVFGNTIIQPNGYANGREVPGTHEVSCTLISHFGDLNGPIVLLDLDKGRFTRDAITSITPEVPWPGMWPDTECFRDPVPISRDLILCAHAPRDQFGLYVIDRYGNRELLYLDRGIGSMCPTLLQPLPAAPQLAAAADPGRDAEPFGEMTMADVYAGISPEVERGRVAYLRLACEVRSDLVKLPDGRYQDDHEPFMHWYAGPVDKVSGPFGWPSYVAKASLGLVPVAPDGSAHFRVPAGKVLYFQALDKDLNELQRMRSVVQLQPGEKRSCIGCHEDRRTAPAVVRKVALQRGADTPQPPPWGAVPFAYEKVVQPVWDRHCVGCHGPAHPKQLDFTATLDADRIPASYRTLIQAGLVHHLDYQYNAGGNEKKPPLSFGVLHSRLVQVLEAGHQKTALSADDWHAVKCWIDLNCPLWPDYLRREDRPGAELATGK